MEYGLSAEQNNIVKEVVNKPKNHKLAIQVNASAGAGKTHTILSLLNRYLHQNPYAKCLYLVFNASMNKYFKYKTKNTKIEIGDFGDTQLVELENFVKSGTYHSFLKDGETLMASLRFAGVKVPNDYLARKKDNTPSPNVSKFAIKPINYAKSGLNEKDIEIIAKSVIRAINDAGALSGDPYEKKDDAYLNKRAREIKHYVAEFFQSYFKNATTTTTPKDCMFAYDRFIKDAKIKLKDENFVTTAIDDIFTEEYQRGLMQQKEQNVYLRTGEIFVNLCNRHLDWHISNGRIEIGHDYYYKKIFEALINNPDLLEKKFSPYDIIIVDEAQDADEMIFSLLHKYMLETNNSPTLLYFGDPKQSIYSFKGSFNVFSWANQEMNRHFLKPMTLSQSYRFGEKIAGFAKQIAQNEYPNDIILGREQICDNINSNILNIESLAKSILAEYTERLERGETKKIKERDKMCLIFRTNARCAETFKDLRVEIAKLLETEEYSYLRGKFSSEMIGLDANVKKEIKEHRNADIKEIIEEADLLNNIRAAIAIDKNLSIEERMKGDLKITINDMLKSESAKQVIANSKYAEKYRYLNFSESSVDKIIKAKTKTNATFLITNCHQSKGKEYKYVVIGDDFLGGRGEYLYNQDEINILHTAITRAREGISFYKSGDNTNIANEFYIKKEVPRKDSEKILEITKVEKDNNGERNEHSYEEYKKYDKAINKGIDYTEHQEYNDEDIAEIENISKAKNINQKKSAPNADIDDILNFMEEASNKIKI